MPHPGFYVMRLARGAPLGPALIYQLCPMVVPRPGAADGPHPERDVRPNQSTTSSELDS